MKQKNSYQISSAKIIVMGELIVNLPVTIIILGSAIILGQFGLGWNLSIIIGVGIGWYSWGKLLDKWKNWALDHNVDRERLFRLGKMGLINFYRHKLMDQKEKNEN
ncbi:MAG: hypothetical protein JXQ87_19635 [Bacteroidia bacterium]